VNEELPTLIVEATAIAGDAGRRFGALNREQLNWKPDAGQWSVAQCFEHLIKINALYFPQLRRIEEEPTRRPGEIVCRGWGASSDR
jgi:hypothetical protein